jgi:hypothetical protein
MEWNAGQREPDGDDPAGDGLSISELRTQLSSTSAVLDYRYLVITSLRASQCARCVLLQRACGGTTVNEAMFDLSTKVAPVSMKTGTGERLP